MQNLTAVVYNSTAIEILWGQPDDQPDQVTYIVTCDDMIQHARRESCSVKGKSISFRWFSCLYCKFGNFCENFILANCVKRHIGDVKIHD